MQNLYFKSKSKKYKSITPIEYQQAIKSFREILNNPIIYPKELYTLGLNIVKKSNNFIILSEENNLGEGFYIIKYKNSSTLQNMISIPHRFHDKYTGIIGFHLIKEHNYRAIAFNTVHRKVMDSAHTSLTLFNAFHIAFASLYPNDRIYQIHGFNGNKHKNIFIKKSQIVLSSTNRQPSQEAIEIHNCLREEGYTSLLYGKEIFELGGTTNTQSKTLKKYDFFNFIHIELNTPLREVLRRDYLSRKKLIKCLP